MKKEPNTLKGIRVIDLFAGIGGFHLALSSFGADIVYASENDIKAAEVYENNFKLKPHGDITKEDINNIPAHEILCAGFPCQPFSISGKQLGFNDTRGTLFFDVARIAKEKQPAIIFLENVKNFESHNNGNTLKVINKTLDEIGYTPFYKVLDASDYGIPHSRKRIYIVAFRKDLEISEFEFPTPIPLKKHIKDIIIKNENISKYILPARYDIIWKDNIHPKLNNKPLRIGTVNKGGQGERIYSTNGTGITLSAYGGGIGAKTGLYLIDGNVRRLTPKECLKLQGFPVTYKLCNNDNVSYKQLGNSVVVNVLQLIIEKIIEKKEIQQWLQVVQK
ncbi:MAG: DNA cytosine methyltransferase [Lachnospira eligens]|jgi:DNA (cytosine-5)-methyltransferase 1